jgi:AhpD family alkylhydroperoxidase
MATSTVIQTPTALLSSAASPSIAPGESHPRLSPIEEPHGIRLRLAYWGMRKYMGKVMTPVKVVSARVPQSLAITSSFLKFSSRGVTLEKELQLLIADRVSQINGCAFCLDLSRAGASRFGAKLEKLDAVADYRASPLFSRRERAALAYAEEITLNRRVSDETFDGLRQSFSERQIVEITLLTGIENFYNMINIPLGIGSDGFCPLPQPKVG